ncbi:Sugar fermentation stimulation like protein [Cucumispora dikerogammari]|nr:Sugar fermentation stimulation like protein [Cucumispora dikerogammari]
MVYPVDMVKEQELNQTSPKRRKSKPLFSLGNLVQGTVLQRPSKYNKSPYVADIRLDDNCTDIIAHAPMLHLNGLIKPGTVVKMTKSKPGGKTTYAIQLVGFKEVNCDNVSTWIGAHPSLGNMVAKYLLEGNFITSALFGKTGDLHIFKIQSEVSMKDENMKIRPDFVVNDKTVVEVKSCVDADYHTDTVPAYGKKSPYVAIVSGESNFDDYKRVGLFPVGKANQKFEEKKVVSARSIRHLRHLSKIAEGINELGYTKSCLLIIVNRGDCSAFRVCHECCPVFADEIIKAKQSGVQIVAARVSWEENGDCYFDEIIPMVLS